MFSYYQSFAGPTIEVSVFVRIFNAYTGLQDPFVDNPKKGTVGF